MPKVAKRPALPRVTKCPVAAIPQPVLKKPALGKKPAADGQFDDVLKARVWFTGKAEAAAEWFPLFKALVEEVVEKLRQLAIELREPMPEETRLEKENLLTLLHEQVATTKVLHINWVDELKVFDRGGSFMASCGGAELPIGSVFPVRRMPIVTEDSRKARKAFFECATTGKMPLWWGSPGTDKAETFRDTAAELGMDVNQVNCTSDATVEGIVGFIEAARAKGAALVFDEADRMPADVWAAVPGKVKEAGIIAGFTFNTRQAEVVPVPAAVEVTCQRLYLSSPPLDLICEVMASWEGFAESKEIGGKLAAFYSACRNMLPKEHHFDFGLRALKATLKQMRLIAEAKGYVDELAIAAEAALCRNFPMFALDFRDKLQAMVKDYLGCEPALPEGWPDTYVMLKDKLSVRHGALLLGASPDDTNAHIAGLGEQAATQGAEVMRVPGTMDGEFAENFEKALKTSVVEDKKVWLVVVVGQNQDQIPVCLEMLNSVLDDNKVFVSQAGERTSLLSGTRVVLLAQGCAIFTPASVSHVGVVAI